jgi:D-methionine transport system ATP-binding protein
MSQPAIVFRQLSKTFSRNGVEVRALDNINLTINQGDIFGVIGTSGAGKSTLLRMINHLETPTVGTVEVQGEALQGISKSRLIQVKKQIGMIFQHFNLLNARTVFHNVAIPLILQGRDKAFIRARVDELLAFVNLSDKAHSYPDELSGGQKQRVGIARALATNPAILLCDEATSALDPQTTVQILLLLQEINQRYGITIVLITHEMSVVQKICNRVQSVIHDRLPQQTLALLSQQPNLQSLRLEFVGSTAQQPIIHRLIRHYAVEVNILFANMSEVQSTILGFMIVQLSGEPAQIAAAKDFLTETGVKISHV